MAVRALARRFPAIDAYLVGVVAIASVYGAVLPIVLFTAKWVYAVPFVLATVFPLVLYASGNPRLFFLVGMVFTAPLGLSINLRGYQHMGGAHAFSINLCDFFLVPLLVFLLRDFYTGARRDVRIPPISAWWLALAAMGAVTVVTGPFRELAAMEVVRMLKLWLLFLVIVNECVRAKQILWVVAALAANAVLNMAIAIAQFAVKRNLGLQPLGEGSEISTLGANLGVYVMEGAVFRVTGLAGHANLYGALLALTLPIYIALLYTDIRPRAKVALWVVIAGSVACLGLTLSRSSWIAFAASGGLLMLALFTLPGLRSRFLALKFLTIAAVGAGLMAGSGMILRRLMQSDSGALDFRFEWLTVAWKMVQDRPVFGFGLNSFIHNLEGYAPYSVAGMYELFGDVFPVVHNIYMLVWSEQGTVGLLLFLALHAHVFWIMLQNLRLGELDGRLYMVSIACGCGMVAILIDGMSSFFIRVQAHGRVFWIVIGLIVAIHYWNVANARVRRGRDAGAGPDPGMAPPAVTRSDA